MSEMIERCARALCMATLNADPTSYELGFRTKHTDRHWPTFVNDARVVIAAMREPTPEMAEAEMDLGGYGSYDGECYCADPSEIWRAMIDEALK